MSHHVTQPQDVPLLLVEIFGDSLTMNSSLYVVLHVTRRRKVKQLKWTLVKSRSAPLAASFDTWPLMADSALP
ncbi:hypothetical protein BgiMline_008345 [Biomphalaria glabrata]